jgi:lipoyl-dependent peroxiredoxin
MPTRRAEAEWNGTLREGKGTIKAESGAFSVPYSFGTRFENEKGTNPEELIGAAHAGCFSMALSGGLSKAGLKPTRIRTKAAVTVEKVGDAFAITKIELDCEGTVPGADDKTFQEQAKAAKEGCPVSKALAGTRITLNAKLVG